MRVIPSMAVAALFLGAGELNLSAQDQRPTFRAGVARVSLNVVVRDERGRPITDLELKDFQILDRGQPAVGGDLRAGEEPVSIALLIDTSGSMRMGERLAFAKRAATLLLKHFRAGDEAALLTFDRVLHEIVPFSTDPTLLRKGLDRIEPFGSTSLHDAVAAAAHALAERPSSRRAVVAITDGIDNSSRLTAAAASGVATSIDVPVYVLTVADFGQPLTTRKVALETVEGGGVARLDDLTAPTGGVSFDAETTAAAYLAGRQILNDLRAGYVLTFTPDSMPGWHQLTVRVARKDVRVRTRAGFWVGAQSPQATETPVEGSAEPAVDHSNVPLARRAE